ncbi:MULTISPECIES: hypothetical protein [Anaeromyxobacter]|nr:MULTISPECIES: hypothetical protein [unclassified Anaeromyxobacter]
MDDDVYFATDDVDFATDDVVRRRSSRRRGWSPPAMWSIRPLGVPRTI